MFGTIRKHQTWLWAIIITLTIISFVIFFSPYARMDSGRGRSMDRGTIYGKKVTDQEFIDAWKESHLHQFMMSGRWPEEDKRGQEAERTAYQWLLLVRKQQQLGIDVSDDAAAKMGRQMIGAFQRLGVNSPQMFFEKILQPKGYSVDDFERFVRHFVGIQELISTEGLAGTLLPPAEIKGLYQRDNQQLATEAAFFWSSNYLGQVNPAPETLTQFYSNRVATYAIPERVQVDYVKFNVTNYLPAAESSITNLNEVVENNYQRMGTNALAGAKSPEEAKAKLREQILRQQALFIARSNANQFLKRVDAMTPAKPENLKTIAAAENLPVQVSAPFDKEAGPKDLEVGQDFTKAAFGLSNDEPYSQVILGMDGAYVLAYNKVLPRETPSFDQVKDQVTNDYKRLQSMMLAQQAARSFHQTLTNALAQGKPFTNICAEANVKVTDLPPFSISTQSLPEVEEVVPLSQLKQAAFGTSPGKASPAFSTSQGAVILYVKAKLPLDPAKLQTDLATYTAQVRRKWQQEAFDDWLRKETERALRDTPFFRPQTPAPTGTAAKS